MRPFPKFRAVMSPEELPDLPVTIYALVDPRDGTVRYVGQTNHPRRRWTQHWESGWSKGASNPRIAEWANDLDGLGLKFRLWTIVRCSTIDADDTERYWIRFYREIGPIFNVDVGHLVGAANCSRCRAMVTCKRCVEYERRRRSQELANASNGPRTALMRARAREQQSPHIFPGDNDQARSVRKSGKF